LIALFVTRDSAQSALSQPAPAGQQAPGAGAQVHTGTTSGIETSARLRNLLADHQFSLVESLLNAMPTDEARFYRGILANRENDSQDSIELLSPLVDRVAAAGDRDKEKLLRKALAEDYLRLGDWAQAAKAYETLNSRLQAQFSPDERDQIEMPLKLLPLAEGNPSMAVEPCDPFVLQVSRNPLGLTDIPVFVDARPHTWMLDPTAPFNLIARSEAKEAGLKVSETGATIRTLTGRPMTIHVAVIPRLTIGGRLTLRHVTVFVYEDQDYYFPQSHYQVQGVLGYPALNALGSLTVTADATIEVRPAKPGNSSGKDDRLARGVPFFLDGDQVIVALCGASTPTGSAPGTCPGQERMLAVDAAGQQTYLTSRYYDEHASDFAGQKMELFSVPGSQSLPPQPAYVAETVPLAVGPTEINLHYVQVLTQPIGSAALDDVYGVLGVDALDQLRAYTFDYRTMRFSVRTE
jgi:hypothetical protein